MGAQDTDQYQDAKVEVVRDLREQVVLCLRAIVRVGIVFDHGRVTNPQDAIEDCGEYRENAHDFSSFRLVQARDLFVFGRNV